MQRLGCLTAWDSEIKGCGFRLKGIWVRGLIRVRFGGFRVQVCLYPLVQEDQLSNLNQSLNLRAKDERSLGLPIARAASWKLQNAGGVRLDTVIFPRGGSGKVLVCISYGIP